MGATHAGSAKVTPPRLAAALPRQRLFRLLDSERKRPAIWVSAPAGFGKTTLMASYLAAREQPCLWYQLDEGDADIATFFHYLGLAAKKAAPRVRRPLPAYTPEFLPGLTTFARRYFEELAGRLPPATLLVLDNYQDVPPDALLHEVIREGLTQISDGMNLAVLSRHDPPASFAGARANNALALIGQEALRLTEEEAAGIARLHRHADEDGLTPQALRQLHEHAHGWAAGLVLMLQSSTHNGQVSGAVPKSDTGVMFDYFAEEVFRRADSDTQDFLLKTSFLPNFTAAAAERLSKNPRAGRMLVGLCQRNFFTVQRAGGVGATFQYHPLFRDFLQNQARAAYGAEQLQPLLRAAARLLIEEQRPDEAAALLTEAQDWGGLGAMLAERALELLSQGRHQTLASSLLAIPEAERSAQPWISYWLGVSRMPYDLVESRRYFQAAHAAFKAANDGAGLMLACSGIVETFNYLGDLVAAEPWMDELTAYLELPIEFPSADVEAMMLGNAIGIVHDRRAHHDPRLTKWVERAIALLSGELDPRARMTLGGYALMHCIDAVKLPQASRIIDMLRPTLEKSGVPIATRVMWSVHEAYYAHWVLADTPRCLAIVEAGLALAQQSGMRQLDVVLAAQGAMGALSGGDYEAAQRYERAMAPHVDGAPGLVSLYYNIAAGWLALALNDLPRAEYHAELAVAVAVGMGVPFGEAIFRLGVAQIQFERGDRASANAYLAQAKEIAARTHSHPLEFFALIAEAHFALAEGRKPEASAALSAAFPIAERHGIVTIPWWRPSVMTPLCGLALEAGICVDYVCRLIRQRQLACDAPVQHLELWPRSLRVRTLGRFELIKDDVPIRFSGKAQRKPLDMLKALIALGGRDVREERLSELLWADSEGDAAHSAFTTTLSRLRKLVGADVIRVGEGRVSLDPQSVWVDAWALEHALSDRADMPLDPENESMQRALSLYRGPFLDGEEEAAWVLPLRERLRSKFLRGLSAEAQRQARVGTHESAIALYQKGLETDGLAEVFYRGLMASYMALGRRAEAVAVFERCRKVLASALGVEPSVETLNLYQAARSGR